MRIENIRKQRSPGRVRVAASVAWEDSDRPGQEIFFETDEVFEADLTCNPHPFLVACVVPALYHGEKRVHIDCEICPELYDNLLKVMGWLRHWYYDPQRALVRIEAKLQSQPLSPCLPERAGFLFSGGIDSYATLLKNRQDVPLSHPASIKDGVIIYGQNIESDNRPETFTKAVAELSPVLREAGVTLIPVYTNIRLLDPDGGFFRDQFHGAILGAVAHALSRRLSKVFVAGDDVIWTMAAFGSHPLLNENYSSYNLRIVHDNILSTRLQKTKLVAGWDAALQNIKVCGPNYPGMNCSRCEKCVRTMLALMALGALDRTQAFRPDEHLAERILKGRIKNLYQQLCYEELLEPLKNIGRIDLARAIETKIAQTQGWRRFKRILMQKARGVDRKYLNGHLRKLKRALFANS